MSTVIEQNWDEAMDHETSLYTVYIIGYGLSILRINTVQHILQVRPTRNVSFARFQILALSVIEIIFHTGSA